MYTVKGWRALDVLLLRRCCWRRSLSACRSSTSARLLSYTSPTQARARRSRRLFTEVGRVVYRLRGRKTQADTHAEGARGRRRGVGERRVNKRERELHALEQSTTPFSLFTLVRTQFLFQGLLP
eukprot:4124381-Pleurochrysis_carterae.AAC.1